MLKNLKSCLPSSCSSGADHGSQNKSRTQTKSPSTKFTFGWFKMLVLLYSMVTYLFDVVSDMVVAYLMYVDGKKYFPLAVTFIIVPAVVMLVVSLRWYVMELHEEDTPQFSRLSLAIRSSLHFLQLGPVVRYVDTFRYGLKLRRAENKYEKELYYNWMVDEDAGAGVLRLFETFMEGAPQTILQIYILAQPDGAESLTTVNVQKASVCFSLISMASGLASFERSWRLAQEEPNHPSYSATIVQFLWHLFVTCSRMFTLGLFTSRFPVAMGIVFAVRWLVATAWLQIQKTNIFYTEDEEPDGKPEKYRGFLLFLYQCAFGVVHLFAYLDSVGEVTRYRYAFYYASIFIENAALITVWYAYEDPNTWYKLPSILLVFLSFIIGIIFMIVYYLLLHPSDSIEICLPKNGTSDEVEITAEDQVPLRTTFLNVSVGSAQRQRNIHENMNSVDTDFVY